MNSLSIPAKPSWLSDSLEIILISSDSPSDIISSKIVSRIPSPELSSKSASTSLFPTPTISSLADPSRTTRLAILAVSIPALKGSVRRIKLSMPNRRASTRSFRISDAAIFNAFMVFPNTSAVFLALSSADRGSASSPSVLRPAMGMVASSAEKDGDRRDGLVIMPSPSVDGEGLAKLGLIILLLGLLMELDLPVRTAGRPSDARG